VTEPRARRETLWPVCCPSRPFSDTEPDPVVLIEHRSLPAVDWQGADDQPWDVTVTEPVPAPLFEAALRRVASSVLLGAGMVAIAVLFAAWLLR
jgi:hypothetical protein